MPRKEVFGGMVLVALGVALIVSRAVGINAGRLLGPLALLVIGAWVLYSAATRQPTDGAEPLSGAPLASSTGSPTIGDDGALLVQERVIPLEGALMVRLRIQHGAGELRVTGGAAAENAVEGHFVGGLVSEAQRQGDELSLQLHSAAQGEAWSGLRRPRGLSWDLHLNTVTPIELLFETGAGSAELDLVDVQARVVTLKTGVSSTHLTLPAGAGHVQARVESGVASVEVIIPSGVAADIHTSSGLASVEVDTHRFPRWEGRYRSLGFDAAPNRVSLEINTGIGSVTVR